MFEGFVRLVIHLAEGVFGIANSFDDNFYRFGHSLIYFFVQFWPGVKSAAGPSLVGLTRRPEPFTEARAKVQITFGSLSSKSSVVFTWHHLAPGVPQGNQGDALKENMRKIQGNSCLLGSE